MQKEQILQPKEKNSLTALIMMVYYKVNDLDLDYTF